jgi:16S rRNA (uracil1498-N3)-methyltransferase
VRWLFDFADTKAYNPDEKYFWNYELHLCLKGTGRLVASWAAGWLARYVKKNIGLIQYPKKRKLKRIAVDQLPEAGGRLVLSKHAARHVKVARARIDSILELYDGKGNKALARLVSVSDQEAVCEVEPCNPELARAHRLVLVQVVPKGSKIDSIVKTCSELGIDAIQLAESERGVSRSSGRDTEKARRLSRIASEAIALAGRRLAPAIYPPLPLLEAAQRAPERAKKIVFNREATDSLGQAIFGPKGSEVQKDEQVWIVIGPEGGLSSAELTALNTMGYQEASLGRFTLRVETAAPAAVALVSYLLGEFNPDRANIPGQTDLSNLNEM